MIRFPRQISSEFFEYTYAGSIEDLRDTLEKVAARSKGFYVSPNLLVKLKPGNEFTVINKFELGTFQRTPFDTSTSLKGYYFKNDLNSTQVNLLVTPHSMFPLLFLLLPVFFILTLFGDFTDSQKFPGFYPIIILAMLTALVGLVFLSAFSKRRLLERFVNYMQLTKIA